MFGFFPFLFLFGACGGRRGNTRGCCCRRPDFSRGGRPVERFDPGLVKITKSSNWSEVRIGDEPEVELTLVNLGAIPFDVFLSDAACGTCNVPGSVAMNGVAAPNANLDIGMPFILNPGESVTVNHRVRMMCPGCACGVALAHYAPTNSAWQCTASNTAISNNWSWTVRCCYQSC